MRSSKGDKVTAIFLVNYDSPLSGHSKIALHPSLSLLITLNFFYYILDLSSHKKQ